MENAIDPGFGDLITYGAPLRLRVETSSDTILSNGLSASSLVKLNDPIGEGEGGKSEGDEYFDLLPNA